MVFEVSGAGDSIGVIVFNLLLNDWPLLPNLCACC